ncbi:ctnA [Symbiodinium sp. KB8]|nr:ctnA [Symbiodinium sp. KB8]
MTICLPHLWLIIAALQYSLLTAAESILSPTLEDLKMHEWGCAMSQSCIEKANLSWGPPTWRLATVLSVVQRSAAWPGGLHAGQRQDQEQTEAAGKATAAASTNSVSRSQISQAAEPFPSESGRRGRKPSKELQQAMSLDEELEALLKTVEEPKIPSATKEPLPVKEPTSEPSKEPAKSAKAAASAEKGPDGQERCSVCGAQFQQGQSIYESTIAGLKQVLCSGCWSDVAPHCVACGKLISGPMAKVGDDAYHQQCLKCAICSKVIDGALSKLDCGICCGACTEEVDKDLRELRRLYSAGDFEGAALVEGSLKARGIKPPELKSRDLGRCSSCQLPFKPGQQVYEKDGDSKMLCEACFLSAAPACAACGKPVVGMVAKNESTTTTGSSSSSSIINVITIITIIVVTFITIMVIIMLIGIIMSARKGNSLCFAQSRREKGLSFDRCCKEPTADCFDGQVLTELPEAARGQGQNRMEGNEEPNDEQPKESTSYFAWLGTTGRPEAEKPEKSGEQVKAERYATQMLALDRVISNWQARSIDKKDALVHCDHILENIKAIGSLDGDMARTCLNDRGISDTRRLELQTAYRELKQTCGHKICTDRADSDRANGASCCRSHGHRCADLRLHTAEYIFPGAPVELDVEAQHRMSVQVLVEPVHCMGDDLYRDYFEERPVLALRAARLQGINLLLNYLLNAGVAEQTICNLACDLAGIKEFVDILNHTDLDPIYFCELLTLCHAGPDDASARIMDIQASPSTISKGETVKLLADINVTKALGVGEFRVAVHGPVTSHISDGFLLPKGLTEGAMQLGAELKVRDDTSGDEPVIWRPGTYTFDIHLCQGECGSKHPHSKDFGTATGNFTLKDALLMV